MGAGPAVGAAIQADAGRARIVTTRPAVGPAVGAAAAACDRLWCIDRIGCELIED